MKDRTLWLNVKHKTATQRIAYATPAPDTTVGELMSACAALDLIVVQALGGVHLANRGGGSLPPSEMIAEALWGENNGATIAEEWAGVKPGAVRVQLGNTDIWPADSMAQA